MLTASDRLRFRFAGHLTASPDHYPGNHLFSNAISVGIAAQSRNLSVLRSTSLHPQEDSVL
jgi:hypothetical protein